MTTPSPVLCPDCAPVERLPLTYCSFADETKCLGVLVLDGELDPIAASLLAHVLGLNPGGELLAVPIPGDMPERDYLAMLENRGRLLSPWEARELLEGKSIREWEAEELAEFAAGVWTQGGDK